MIKRRVSERTSGIDESIVQLMREQGFGQLSQPEFCYTCDIVDIRRPFLGIQVNSIDI